MTVRIFAVIAIQLWALILSAPVIAQDNPGATSNRQHINVDSKIYAGPHLDGDSYRRLRPDADFAVLLFNVDKAGSAQGQVSVTLGPDFVIERNAAGATSVYDFRFRRLINIESESLRFNNNSLFGYWHQRWAFLSNNLYVVGAVAAASIIERLEIERYWIEQKNGVAHPQPVAFQTLPKSELREQQGDGKISYFIGDVLVAEGEFSDTSFPSAGHAQTFAVWLVWSQRVHPDLSARIASSNMLPNELIVMGRDEIAAPGSPAQASVMNFGGAVFGRDKFDVLDGLTPIAPVWEGRVSPAMGELMMAAARGEALDGPESDAEYIAQIESLASNGKAFDTMLLAIHASNGCTDDGASRPLCDIAVDAISDVYDNDSVFALVSALGGDQDGRHADAAKAMIALRNENPERIDILNIMIANSLVEANNNQQLDDELQREFESLPQVFEEAFRRDPYSPSRYRDFYNYLHASTTTTDESYAVHALAYPVADLGRSIPERRVPDILAVISDVEERIATDFVNHFPVFD